LTETTGIGRDVRLEKIVERLTEAGVIDAAGANGIQEFLEVGKRIAYGAHVSATAAEDILREGHRVIYALRVLRSRQAGSKKWARGGVVQGYRRNRSAVAARIGSRDAGAKRPHRRGGGRPRERRVRSQG
jgi:hypothetical protein